MADIKFMDISENANPSTTDSVLVGNSTNGVKRVSLENIKGLIAPNVKALHIEYVTTPLNSNNSKKTLVTAPNVNGYTFMCWINSANINQYFGTWFENPLDTEAWAHTDKVLSDFTSGDTPKIGAWALYVNNELA